MKCNVCGKENCEFQAKYMNKEKELAQPLQQTTIVLVDLNPKVVEAFTEAFKDQTDVQVKCASITDQKTDAWVTPTNSKGNMSGGVDAAIKNNLGVYIENSLKTQISSIFGGSFPVGRAINVRTNSVTNPKFVIATPTMVGESDDVSRTKNAALACAAVFQAIYSLRDLVGTVNSIAIPGLGSGTGKMSPEKCAKLMFAGYLLFKGQRYSTFEDMEKALYALLEKMNVLTPEKPSVKTTLAEEPSIVDLIAETDVTNEVITTKLGLTQKQKLTLKALNDLTSLVGDNSTARSGHIGLRVKELSAVTSKVLQRDPGEWASDKLKRLVTRGLVKRVKKGRYSLTDAGREAIKSL